MKKSARAGVMGERALARQEEVYISTAQREKELEAEVGTLNLELMDLKLDLQKLEMQLEECQRKHSDDMKKCVEDKDTTIRDMEDHLARFKNEVTEREEKTRAASENERKDMQDGHKRALEEAEAVLGHLALGIKMAQAESLKAKEEVFAAQEVVSKMEKEMKTKEEEAIKMVARGLSKEKNIVTAQAVSYTHLTLPTIYSV